MYNQIAANKRQSFFLMILFAAVVIGLAYFFSWYLQSGYGLVVAAVGFSLVSSLISFYASDKIALGIAGAKAIQQQDNPYVYRLVENLAITAGIPAPTLIEITDSMSPEEVRRARVANAKASSAYNKALKAAGIDPATMK